jgi:hypothetical protein
MSLLAVAFVTGTIFWMRATARTIAAELRGKLDRALEIGPAAVVTLPFLAVGREGGHWGDTLLRVSPTFRTRESYFQDHHVLRSGPPNSTLRTNDLVLNVELGGRERRTHAF